MADCGLNYKGANYTKEELTELMKDPVFAEDLRVNILTDKFLEILMSSNKSTPVSEIFEILTSQGLLSSDMKQRKLDADKIYSNIANRNINNDRVYSHSKYGPQILNWVNDKFGGIIKSINRKYGQGSLKSENKTVYESFITAQNRIKFELKQAEKVANSLNNLINSLGKNLSSKDKLAITAIMQGADPREVLDLANIKDINKKEEVIKDITKISKKARLHIDNLTNLLISSGYLSEAGVDIFVNNKGKYIVRVYESHINPERWFNKLKNSDDPEIAAVFKRGKKFIKDSLINRQNRIENLIKKDQDELRKNIKGPEPANLYEILVQVGAIDNTTMSKKEFKELPLEERVSLYNSSREAQKMVKKRNDFLYTRINERKQNATIIKKILESDDSLVNYIEQTLSEGQKNPFDKEGNPVKSSLSIFKKRGDIPKEIRDLMGEVRDPIGAYLASIKKMIEFQAKYDFQLSFALAGENTLFSRTKTDYFDTPISVANMPGVRDALVTIDDKIYVTKELADDFAQQVKDASAYAMFTIFINSVSKFNATVGSPITQERNFSTAPSFMILNGNLFNRNFINSFKIILGEIASLSVEGVSAKFGRKIDIRNTFLSYLSDSAVKYGVVDSSVDIGELSEYWDRVKNNSWFKAFSNKITNEETKKVAEKVTDIALTPLQLLIAAYKASDDLIKLASYYGELDRLAPTIGDYKGFEDIKSKADSGDQKAIIDLKSLEYTAAKAVRDTVANYSEAWRINQAIRKLPLGTFTTFITESLRIQWNALNYTFEALKESRNPNNTDSQRAAWARIFRQRFLGIITIYTATYFQEDLREFTSSMFGFDDEEEKYLTTTDKQRDVFLKHWAPKWLIFIDLRRAKGEDAFVYSDPSSMNPFSLLNNFNFDRNNSETILGDLAYYFAPILSVFLTPSLGTEGLVNILTNRDEFNNKISIYEKDTPQYWIDIWDYIVNKSLLLPRVFQEMKYVSDKEEQIKSLEMKIPNQSDEQAYSTKLRIRELQEAIANHTKKYQYLGYKDTYVEIHKAAEYKLFELSEIIDELKNEYRSKVKVDSDNFQKYYDKYNKEFKDELKKYKKMFTETYEILGVDISEDWKRTNKLTRIEGSVIDYLIDESDEAPDLKISDYEQRGGEYLGTEEEEDN